MYLGKLAPGGALAMALAVVIALVAVVACETSNETGPDAGQGASATGALALALTLPGGETLASASWTLEQGTSTILTGVAPVPAGATTVSLFIPNVPAGSGYTVTITGTSPDGDVTCAGTSASFGVAAQATTNVALYLACGPSSGTDAGGVQVNGTAVDCATWTSATAFPSAAPSGGTVALYAGAVAPNLGALTYAWSASAGSIDTPSQMSADYTCPGAPMTVTITLTVGDGPVPPGASCPAAASRTSFTVTCGTPIDAGVDAGPGDAGPGDSGASAQLLPCGQALLEAGTTSMGKCVQCQGSPGGVCTPDESTLVQSDINRGYATAPGAAPSASCYACLLANHALDDTAAYGGDTGHECKDLSTNAKGLLCESVLTCVLPSSCAWGGSVTSSSIVDCYCGTASSAACDANPSSANGACASKEALGLGFTSTTNGVAILAAYGNTTLGAGMANALFQAAISAPDGGCPWCLH
jgi:hypothetical protein